MPVAPADAHGLDQVARGLLSELAAIPGVRRAGVALSEGGGRQLRFVASDSLTEQALDWCQIDAYEDVPLTAVVSSGEPIFNARDAMHSRYAGFVASQPEQVRSIAALPLPGDGAPLGGVIVYFDETGDLGVEQQRRLTELAARAGRAIQRQHATGWTTSASPAEDGVRRLVLDDGPQSVARARHFLRDVLRDSGISEDVADTAQLCLSELATNAVIHARGSYELHVSLAAGVLTVAVTDHGGAQEAVVMDADSDPLRVYGRGLQLVGALAHRWGADQHPHGSTVWFALEAD